MITQEQVVRGSTSTEAMVNDESRMLDTFAVGDVSRQGDIYIVGIEKLPNSAKKRLNHQLADGDTQGSRHVLTPNGSVYDCKASEVVGLIKKATGRSIDERYVGPVFVSPDAPTADDLSHPEHGNQGFPAGMVCAVVFQRVLDAELREMRVRD